jgi:hypothetical protein
MDSRRISPRTALLAAAALLAPVWALLAGGTDTPALLSQTEPPAEARYRGCDAEGWCLFQIESQQPLARQVVRVRPEGVAQAAASDPIALELRNRLNALLASMIHQSKQIVLRDLRPLDDGTFAAAITVNGVELAEDPLLVELGRRAGRPGKAVQRPE